METQTSVLNFEQSAIDRFWQRVQKAVDCWNWIGSMNVWGYGQLTLRRSRRKTEAAHRLSWEIHNGPIPDGLFVLHKCDNRKCVNPDHLFLGTQKDNVQDCVKKGRKFSFYRGVTHCKHGHEFTPENTGRSADGKFRYCRTCNKQRSTARWNNGGREERARARAEQ